MELAEKQNCPICGCDTAHLNNHVRMSNDDGHGPTQQYPEGWDRDSESFDGDRSDLDQGDVAIDQDEDDQDEDDQGESLVIDDQPSDYRTYRCPEDDCNETVEYLQDECSNGHSQNWVVV